MAMMDQVEDDIENPVVEETAALEVSEQEEADDLDKIEEVMDELAQSIESKFRDRYRKMGPKIQQMLLCDELYLGSAAAKDGSSKGVTSDKPFGSSSAISGSPPEHDIIRVPCDSVVSILHSKQFAGGDKNWNIKHSPDPRDINGNPIDPALAAAAASAMENVIWDQLNQCRYGFEAREAMYDRVVRGTGILKGPINLGRMERKYSLSINSNNEPVYSPALSKVSSPHVRRVNPMFFFPDLTVIDETKNEDTIELHPMSRSELHQLSLNESFIKEAIVAVLEEGAKSCLEGEGVGQDFANLNNNFEAFKNKFLVLEYYGPVTLDEMGKLGVEPTYDSPDDIYYAEVWVVNGKVIRFDQHPIEGCFRPPYAVCPYVKDPGSQFGIGLPLLMADQQRVINTTYRMTLDNAYISSGPQVVINKTQVKPADGSNTLRPDKIWHNTEYNLNGDASKAINFFVPPNVTPELINIMNLAKQFAQEQSGFSLLQAGLQSPGVTNSATGDALIAEASTTPIDYLNEMWDDRITHFVVSSMVDWNMQYNPDPQIKGDYEVDIRGPSDMRNRQMYLQDLEKLSVEVSSNPDTAGLYINPDKVFQARLASMRINPKEFVRTPEEIEQIKQEKANQPNPEMEKINLEKQKLEIETQKLQLEMQKLQMEMENNQLLAQWKHEEAMQAAQARMYEAQAQVLSKASEERIEFARLAQQDKEHAADAMLKINEIQINDNREKFLAGIDASLEVRKIKNTEKELTLAKNTGEGI